jgi:hypothetical protein
MESNLNRHVQDTTGDVPQRYKPDRSAASSYLEIK